MKREVNGEGVLELERECIRHRGIEREQERCSKRVGDRERESDIKS